MITKCRHSIMLTKEKQKHSYRGYCYKNVIKTRELKLR